MTVFGWNRLIDVADVLELGDRAAWWFAAEKATSWFRKDQARRNKATDSENKEN